MARYPRLMPPDPQLLTAEVLRSQRVSPSFQRVTISGGTLDRFDWKGFDHWFRLFLPPAPGVPLTLPEVRGRSWWQPYLAIPDAQRPHCSNYTVADYRTRDGRAELDIDVVLHWDSDGEVAGGVAVWAVTAEVGSPLAILDQGVLFDRPSDADHVCLVTDETGLPAVRGILRDLDPHVTGVAIIEVPTADDGQDLAAPAGVSIVLVPRNGSPAVPGVAALEALRAQPGPQADAYAFVVGESTLAVEGRRALHRAGLPKSRITFSGFWKHAGDETAAA